MSDLERYISSTRPAHKRSPLHAHAAVIERLRAEGFSWQQVADYLEAGFGLRMHRNNLLHWHARNVSQGRDQSAPAMAGQDRLSPAQVAPKITDVAADHAPARSALDALLDGCQSDVPGLPERLRPKG